MPNPFSTLLFTLAPVPRLGRSEVPPRASVASGGDNPNEPPLAFDPRWPPHEPRWIELREYHALLPFV
jgi:hypothetical protein